MTTSRSGDGKMLRTLEVLHAELALLVKELKVVHKFTLTTSL
jgi:hypothetical protein